jgi:hypothetical protein
MVHNLTLGRIIGLNTDFKSVPESVFFSTLHCESVENYQCKPRAPSTSCGNNGSSTERETAEQEALSRHQKYGSSILIGLAVLSSLSFMMAVLFIILWFQQRKHIRLLQNNDKVQQEMHCFTDTSVNENLHI